MSRAENIAAFVTSGDSIPMAVERAIYGWLYVDAGASWGHREAVLLQDRSLNNPPVPPNMSLSYKNNVAVKRMRATLALVLLPVVTTLSMARAGTMGLWLS